MNEPFESRLTWPQWKPLRFLEKHPGLRSMGGDRTPLEPILRAPPPREIDIRHGWSSELSRPDREFRQVLERWSATRGWVLGSEEVPDREGPTWKLDVVFYVGDSPVIANFQDASDKMHGVGGARVHDRWYHRLMQTIGAPTSVLHDTNGNCFLFGDMNPYVFHRFTDALQLALESQDPDDVREHVDTCVEIVRDMEDERLAWRALSCSGRPGSYADRGEWCRTAFTANRLGTDDLRVYLARMRPFLADEGCWFWAAH